MAEGGILDISKEISRIKDDLGPSKGLRINYRTKKRNGSEPDSQEYWDTKLSVAQQVHAASHAPDISEKNEENDYSAVEEVFPSEGFEWLDQGTEPGTVEIWTDSQYTGRLVQHETKVAHYDYDSPREAARHIERVPGKLMQVIERRPHVDRLLLEVPGNSFQSMYESGFSSGPRFEDVEEFKEFYSAD